MADSRLTITVAVDTTELDAAIVKAEYLKTLTQPTITVGHGLIGSEADLAEAVSKALKRAVGNGELPPELRGPVRV